MAKRQKHLGDDGATSDSTDDTIVTLTNLVKRLRQKNQSLGQELNAQRDRIHRLKMDLDAKRQRTPAVEENECQITSATHAMVVAELDETKRKCAELAAALETCDVQRQAVLDQLALAKKDHAVEIGTALNKLVVLQNKCDELEEIESRKNAEIASLKKHAYQDALTTIRDRLMSVAASHEPTPEIPVTPAPEYFCSAILTSLPHLRAAAMDKITNHWLPHVDLELIYRGTRDGMYPGAYHVRCNHQAATITLVKAHDDSVFGAYASSVWLNSGGVYRSDPECFLFTILHPTGEGTKNLVKIVVDPTNPAYATRTLYSRSCRGPTFGASGKLFKTHAISITSGTWGVFTPFNGKCSTCLKDGETFQGPAVHGIKYLTSSYNFTPEEIEVFRVVARS